MAKVLVNTMDTETLGGASRPQGTYDVGGFIHDLQGNVITDYHFLIRPNFEQIEDAYYKKNFPKYATMIENGWVEMVNSADEAIEKIMALNDKYGVKYMTAYNAGFDFFKTEFSALLDRYEFIDVWLMALETVVQQKRFQKFVLTNGMASSSKKSISTTAEALYSFIINDPCYEEEHTAWEDAKIEKEIFARCYRTHKKFTRNATVQSAKGFDLIPRWDEAFTRTTLAYRQTEKLFKDFC